MKRWPWSPYISGALAAVVSLLSIVLVGKFFGASTSFVRVAGMIEQWLVPAHVSKLEYFAKKAPIVEWQVMLVGGIFVGSLLSAVMSGSFSFESVPPMWRERFGPSVFFRALVAILGGAIAMFGARLAGGCPSGHGLSGMMQLSLSAFIAAPLFFIGGIMMARMIYRNRR